MPETIRGPLTPTEEPMNMQGASAREMTLQERVQRAADGLLGIQDELVRISDLLKAQESRTEAEEAVLRAETLERRARAFGGRR